MRSLCSAGIMETVMPMVPHLHSSQMQQDTRNAMPSPAAGMDGQRSAEKYTTLRGA